MELKNIKNYKPHGTEKYQKLRTPWNWKKWVQSIRELEDVRKQCYDRERTMPEQIVLLIVGYGKTKKKINNKFQNLQLILHTTNHAYN